jgi:Tfp pilus assembly protein PilP
MRGLFFSSLLLSVLLFVAPGRGLAAQEEVINKDRRPLGEVAETGKPGPGDKMDRSYLYDPTNKTDPFQSFIAVREEKEKEEKKKPRTYLETLELSQLTLVAIAIGPEGKWAMVKDSKDIGHVIKEGTPIGTNGGVVYKIDEGEVIIREEYKDFRGRLQYRDISKKTPSER